MANGKTDSGTAVLLEVLGAFVIHTFGIGWIYAGEVGKGLMFMIGWWVIAFVNFLLCFILIGAFTWPLCWVAMLCVSAMTLSKHCQRKETES